MFALHPINVDSVVWVAERKNVLSTLFWMLTMWAYAGYARRGGWGRYLLTLLFYALGLLSKPMLVTLPFVLLLLDYWPLGRFRYEPVRDSGGGGRDRAVAAGIQVSVLFRLVREKIPFFVLSLVSVYSFCSLVEESGFPVSQVLVPVKLRIANALVSYVSYIGKMIWPGNLAVYYPYPNVVPTFKATGALLWLVCISVLVILALRRRPYLAIGWLWYLGTLVPVIGLYQAGLWPAMSDRWAYVPLIGLFVIIAWAVADLVAKWRYRRIVTALSAAAVLSASVLCTRMQVQHWQNSATLYKHATVVVPDNWWAHNALGKVLGSQVRFDEAIAQFTEALRVDPNNAETKNELGKALLLQGRLDEAVVQFTEVLRIDPNNAEIKNELGKALLQQGKVEEAVELYQQFLPKLPDDMNDSNAVDLAFARQGKLAEVVRVYTEAHANLSMALFQQGKFDEAIRHYKEVLRFRPEFVVVDAHKELGNALLQQGRLEEAIKVYQLSLIHI